MKEHRVSYTLELDGRFYIVEDVPATLDEHTGESLFAPETVERLHTLVRGSQKPHRMMDTPVYSFTESAA